MLTKLQEVLSNFNFFYQTKRKNKANEEIRKQVILLGDGFFARGFLHHIDYKKYNIIQVYKDAFINPQDLMYSLQREMPYKSDNNVHFRDIITRFKSRNSLTKICEEIKTLEINKMGIIDYVKINDETYGFDYLVIGLGSQKSLKSWCDEINHLIKEKSKNIAMVGLGPVGLELTMILSKNNKIDVYDSLSSDKILSYVRPQTKDYLLNILEKKQIKLNLEQFYNKEKNSHDKIIFCVGSRSNSLTANLKVNDNLSLDTNEKVYVGGDCAQLSYIKTAQMAYQQGEYVAKKLNGEIDKNEKFKFKSNGISLNLPDKKVIIENHPILHSAIYPDFIIRLYSLFIM
jgi:NADH dehydrogenase FAD-containing subunit